MSFRQPTFEAGQVTTPALLSPDADFRAVSLNAPFLFSGQVSGFRDAVGEGAPLFTANLTGSGTATLRLIDDGSGLWRFPDVRFLFEQPGVATPEPGSLVLLASGLAGGLIGARRKRR